jgi:hypothetical protein
MRLSQSRCVRISIGLAGLFALLCVTVAWAASGSSGLLAACRSSYQLMPLQYQGTLTVQFNTANQTVNLFTAAGGIPQAAGGCTFTLAPTGFPWTYTKLEDFQSTKETDLVGVCEQIPGALDIYFSPAGCARGTHLRITSAQNLRFNAARDAFTVDVVLREMVAPAR